jgi:hypothetical protein
MWLMVNTRLFALCGEDFDRNVGSGETFKAVGGPTSIEFGGCGVVVVAGDVEFIRQCEIGLCGGIPVLEVLEAVSDGLVVVIDDDASATRSVLCIQNECTEVDCLTCVDGRMMVMREELWSFLRFSICFYLIHMKRTFRSSKIS